MNRPQHNRGNSFAARIAAAQTQHAAKYMPAGFIGVLKCNKYGEISVRNTTAYAANFTVVESNGVLPVGDTVDWYQADNDSYPSSVKGFLKQVMRSVLEYWPGFISDMPDCEAFTEYDMTPESIDRISGMDPNTGEVYSETLCNSVDLLIGVETRNKPTLKGDPFTWHIWRTPDQARQAMAIYVAPPPPAEPEPVEPGYQGHPATPPPPPGRGPATPPPPPGRGPATPPPPPGRGPAARRPLPVAPVAINNEDTPF